LENNDGLSAENDSSVICSIIFGLFYCYLSTFAMYDKGADGHRSRTIHPIGLGAVFMQIEKY